MMDSDLIAIAPQLVQEEYFFLLKTYESYNDQSLLIKGWSVTVGMGALLTAYLAAPKDRPGQVVVLCAALSVIPFWLTDALWKYFQTGYLTRLCAIEHHLRAASSADEPAWIGACASRGAQPLTAPPADAAVHIAPLQVITEWGGSLSAETVFRAFVGAFFTPSVLLPHGVILLAGLGFWLCVPTRAKPQRDPEDIKTEQESPS